MGPATTNQAFAASVPTSSGCREDTAISTESRHNRTMDHKCDQQKARQPELGEPLLKPKDRVEKLEEQMAQMQQCGVAKSDNSLGMQGRVSELERSIVEKEFRVPSKDARDAVLSRASDAPPTSSGPQLSTCNILKVRRQSRAPTMSGNEVSMDQEQKTNLEGLKGIFLSPICILLFCAPLGVASWFLKWGDNYTFWFNFFAMIPLAKILGDATEELSACLKNDMLCGLLNATFGNAVEMIITVALLQDHQYAVVKSTLLGSVLSNMLLVLGMSFFAGGLTSVKSSESGDAELGDEVGPAKSIMNKEQSFSEMGALSNTSMLLLSSFVLVLVTVFKETVAATGTPADTLTRVLKVSRYASIAVIVSYVASIIFQLVTHKDAMADSGEDEGDDEDEEESSLSMGASLMLLFSSTCVVAGCSELLTNSLEGALEGSQIGEAFLGIVLLPIVGNACEHAAAIRFAMQDKAGLSVGIAIGSSVQIALFVTPLSVVMGWMLGDADDGSNMNLNFTPLDCAVLLLSVLVILSILVDGKANWLEGFLLCTAYVVVGFIYWFLPESAMSV